MLKVEPSKIKQAIYENPDFSTYKLKVNEIFEAWQNKFMPVLKNLSVGFKPKQLIFDLSEGILSAFSQTELIDNYDIYQNLMTYWAETMQDDAYQIAAGAWKAEINIIKNKKGKETGWDCDLIPKNLVINKYFSNEQKAIAELAEKKEQIAQQIQILEEENAGEDDLLAEVKNDSGNVSRTDVIKRLREINGNKELIEETKVLQAYLDLLEQETELNSKIRETELELDKKLFQKFRALSEQEIKLLVIEDKWLKFMQDSIRNELNRISQGLAGRIKDLAERYNLTLPKLTAEVEERTKKFDNHLAEMGFKW
jgi:type I restriction enzyme M protein